LLSTFASGELTAFVKPSRDLHTLKDFDCTRERAGLGADVLRFAGASAAAELVLAHAEQERHGALFHALESTLDALEVAVGEAIPGAALGGLWAIVDAFGFAPQLDPCVRCGRALGPDEMGRFDLAAGGVRCAACAGDCAGPRVGPGARAQLLGLLGGGGPDCLTHTRAHLSLLSDFVAYHVVSRPLKSLRFLGTTLPPDVEVDP
jgi:DNA repair protein RecO (recombination protein O)